MSDVNETEEAASVPESNGEDSNSTPKLEEQQDDNGTEAGQSTFSYEQLRAKSENPVTGIDFKRREVGSTLSMITSFKFLCVLPAISIYFPGTFSGLSLRRGVSDHTGDD